MLNTTKISKNPRICTHFVSQKMSKSSAQALNQINSRLIFLKSSKESAECNFGLGIMYQRVKIFSFLAILSKQMSFGREKLIKCLCFVDNNFMIFYQDANDIRLNGRKFLGPSSWSSLSISIKSWFLAGLNCIWW